MHNEYFYHNEPHNDAPSVSVRRLTNRAAPQRRKANNTQKNTRAIGTTQRDRSPAGAN